MVRKRKGGDRAGWWERERGETERDGEKEKRGREGEMVGNRKGVEKEREREGR